MAKSFVIGKTTKDLIMMDIDDFNKLNVQELRQVVGRLASTANKRLKSFDQTGENSPAVRYIRRSGGAFSTKGKSLNQLRAEYVRARNFLESMTSTLRGWDKAQMKSIRELDKLGIHITKNQFHDFWKTYSELKEMSPEVANKSFKYTVLDYISESLNDKAESPEELAERIHENLSRIYEERAEKYGFEGVSKFFEL